MTHAVPAAAVLMAVIRMLSAPVIGEPSDTVAQINSDTITRARYYARLEAVPVQTKLGSQPAGSYVMQLMITELLVKQLAEKEGVPVTEEQIQKKWDYQEKMNGSDFERSQKEAGSTPEGWRAQERINQAYLNVVTKGVSISEDEAKKAYEKEINTPNSPLKRPEQVLISAIGASSKAKIDKAYQLLQSQDFGSVVVKMSEIPGSAETQGILGWVGRADSRIPKSVTRAAFDLKAGKFGKPLQVGKQWVILKADKRRPAWTPAFDDVKDVLLEQMKVRKATESGSFAKTFQSFLKDSDMTILLEQFKNMPDLMKKNAAQQIEDMTKGLNRDDASAAGPPK